MDVLGEAMATEEHRFPSRVNADEDLSENADGDLTHQAVILADRQFRVDPPPA